MITNSVILLVCGQASRTLLNMNFNLIYRNGKHKFLHKRKLSN